MTVALLFWLLVFACCGTGAYYGGRTGRWIAVTYILACLGTIAAIWIDPDWAHTNKPTFAVDMALMVVLLAIAMSSQRWFAIWFAGLHLVALSSHFASMFVPHFLYKTYFLLQGFWSVPMLLTFAAGAMMDHKAGVTDGKPGNSPA
jgi:hypothetical protein